MAAYIIFVREKMLDQSEFDIYSDEIRSTLQGHQIKILAAYGAHDTLEGSPIEGGVIAEFPSMAEAKAWYYSPAYQQVAKHRHKGATYHGYLLDGI